jgi:hypothetical protein
MGFLLEILLMSEAFVYIWRNAKTNKYYIGSHRGTIDDGYTHSSKHLPDFPRYSRVIPKHYSRRILAYGTESEMWALEDKLQLNRKVKCWDRYYNVHVSNNGRKPPPIKWLYECFELDADTGTLVWKMRPLHHFTSPQYQKRHHTVHAGTEVGNISSQGYRVVCVTWEGTRLQWSQHRIVWAMHYGQWPTKALDHIDGNKTNNVITNLREVTDKENSKNRRISKNNTSGHMGVFLDKRSNKWRAEIRVSGISIGLGTHPNIEDAIAARQAAEIKYGFHKNHGKS